MTVRSKAYLKTRFELGDRPTQEDFGDLIDSYQNIFTSAGGGTFGVQMLATNTTAEAQALLDLPALIPAFSTLGRQIASAATTAAAQDVLGAGAVGKQLFVVTTTAEAQNIIGTVTETAWTDYSATSTVTGWSSFSTKLIYVKKIGRTVFVQFALNGTSNSTAVTFTLPYTCSNTTDANSLIRAQDNSGTAVAGIAIVGSNTATVTCYRDMAANSWTAANAKFAIGELFYEST